MKMDIQKKIWTSRYEKGVFNVAFVHTCTLTACVERECLTDRQFLLQAINR